MEDLEIYQIAQEVIASIADDLSKGIYAEKGGSLQIGWSEDRRVSAWAKSKGDIDKPPQHHIVICYELARQFYRDAEEFYKFSVHAQTLPHWEHIFESFDPKPKLPDHIIDTDAIRNMFIGSLTWVFFHELAHLNQEHLYIREKFGGEVESAQIEDAESDGSMQLEGRESLISHVTEIAADVEATLSCIGELIRHFLDPETGDADKEYRFLEFRSNLYLLVCGISGAFYRFHGNNPVQPQATSVGSHPTPIRRLEICIPTVFEKLDVGKHYNDLHGLSRSDLVYRCTGAAYTSGFFWAQKYHPGVIPENFMVKGLLQDPFAKSYWGAIIDAWDEIESTVEKISRFESKYGLLSFSTTFRSQISESS